MYFPIILANSWRSFGACAVISLSRFLNKKIVMTRKSGTMSGSCSRQSTMIWRSAKQQRIAEAVSLQDAILAGLPPFLRTEPGLAAEYCLSSRHDATV